MPEPRKTIFVSYAHKDRKWVDELTTHLAPWIRDGRVSLWDDRQIQPGADWRKAIDAALDEATVAVLIVTPHFLASDFIMQHELPRLFERARKKELRVMWIAAEHSSFAATPLAEYQAVNDPSRPLSTLPAPKRAEELVDIAGGIADAVTIGSFASSLQIIDETTEPIEAALERRPERKDRIFSVQAVYEPRSDQIAFTGTPATITAADLKLLPEPDRQFIADLEDSLNRNYERWRTVRRKLGDAGGTLDAEIEVELARITKLICKDLNHILNFLRDMHKYDLEDHYGRYRYICNELTAA